MKYQSEASINKVLAQLQLAKTAIVQDTESEEETFEILLREALQSENEAVKIYGKLKKKSDILGSKVLVKAFDELRKDEQEHIGNLQYLVKLLCPGSVENEKEGEAEELKLQASTEE